MKAAALTGITQIKIVDTEKPILKNEDDVLLHLAYAGICGSDIHYFTQGRIGDQIVQFPYTIGHEFSAIVEQTGSAVNNVKAGDSVAVEPAISCGKCSQCLIGRFNTCEKLLFLGCPGQLEGCYSEYIVMPARNCFPLPKDLDLQLGAFVEPLSIGVYSASFIKGKINSAAILGTGTIGLSVLLACQSKGINKIISTDKIASRNSLAKEIGTELSITPEQLEKEIKNFGQVDVVFECCGKQEAIDQAIDILKPGGMLVLVGIPEEDFINFNISKLRRKELSIHNVRRQNECIPEAIRLTKLNDNKIKKIITHIFPMANASDAFSKVSNYEDGIVKALLRFD